MRMISALEMMNYMPRPSATHQHLGQKALAHHAFSLLCATEAFEDVVAYEVKDLALALQQAALKFFEETNTSMFDQEDDDAIKNPMSDIKNFERFEVVYSCLNEFSEDFTASNWRAQISWRNVQEYYRAARVLLLAQIA